MRIAFCEILQKPFLSTRRQQADKRSHQGRRNRHQEVYSRPSRRNPHHVAARPAQRGKVHRNRLGVTKKEGRTQQQEHRRQHDRTERIDVLEGIEADPALAPGRVVAEPMRHEAVRRLMEGNGQDDRHHPGRSGVDRHGQLLIHYAAASAVIRSSFRRLRAAKRTDPGPARTAVRFAGWPTKSTCRRGCAGRSRLPAPRSDHGRCPRRCGRRQRCGSCRSC